MANTDRQRQLENLIRQHPDWGYKKLNTELKTSGQGIRKQTLLDVKRKVLRRAAPTPRAKARTKLIHLITVYIGGATPNELVKQLRADGFKDFEIAGLLARKRKLKDGTFIDTTPPPMDGDTMTSMVQGRGSLLSDVNPENYDTVIVGSYQANGWTDDEGGMDFWKMFRQFFKNSGSPLGKKTQTTIKFDKDDVSKQKKSHHTKKRIATAYPSGPAPGAQVINPVTGKAEWKQARWDGYGWVLN